MTPASSYGAECDAYYASEIWKHSPAEQAWGVISRGESELDLIKKTVDGEMVRLSKEDMPPVDFRQLKIPAEDGKWVTPDSVINGTVGYVGDTLITLAYANKWFEQNTGIIVLPDEISVGDEIEFRAGTFALAASQWKCLEHAWDRSRLYKAKFRLQEQQFPIKEGGFQVAKVLEVTKAEKLEMLDQIAQQRLQQVFFQHQKNRYLEKRISSQPLSTSSAAAEYLSLEEEVACEILNGYFHLPIDDDSVKVGGLPLKIWLRGYAYYTRLARDADGKPIFTRLHLSEDKLLGDLVSVGFTEDQGRQFISLTTFSRGVADLFDAPLLKVSDGSYRFYAPAYHAPALGLILLSRISWLNRRRNDLGEPANDSSFEDKGKKFENHVLKIFTDAGIPACGFKYKIGTTEYDCDAVALLGDTLFVFECKNRSLPMGHLPSLHYFMLALHEAQGQVKRIAQQLSDHPEFVTDNLGATSHWNRIVPVVLHALPWSYDRSGGVYTYDESALSHLLHDGFTSVVAEHKVNGHTVQRRHRYPLRKGNIPTALELEQEMELPNQLRLHSLGWEQEVYPVQISHDVVLALPRWTQRNTPLKEQMIALGSNEREAEEIANQMSHEVPNFLYQKRSALPKNRAEKKIGRNELCPCGSTKKYKKCCLIS